MKTIKTTAGQTAKKLAAIVFACGFIFLSCKKDGATGPQGPVGANGTNGVANIQVQNAFGVQFSTTTPYNIFLTDASITQSIFNTGTVQVFIQNTSSPSLWEAAPDGYFYPVFIQAGSVYIGSPTNWTAVGNSYNVKVVTIPPAMLKPNVNTHNYESVKAAYNLKD